MQVPVQASEDEERGEAMNVQVTYFKRSGKYYTHCAWSVPDDLLHHHVVAKFRGLATNGGPGAMPGLGGGSEGWEGYVLLLVGDVPHVLDLHREEAAQ